MNFMNKIQQVLLVKTKKTLLVHINKSTSCYKKKVLNNFVYNISMFVLERNILSVYNIYIVCKKRRAETIYKSVST